MGDLEILERAWAVTDALCCCRYHSGVVNAAPIIAAAELRRLADRFITESRCPMNAQELVTVVFTMLQSRADELDPEGKP